MSRACLLLIFSLTCVLAELESEILYQGTHTTMYKDGSIWIKNLPRDVTPLQLSVFLEDRLAFKEALRRREPVFSSASEMLHAFFPLSPTAFAHEMIQMTKDQEEWTPLMEVYASYLLLHSLINLNIATLENSADIVKELDFLSYLLSSHAFHEL